MVSQSKGGYPDITIFPNHIERVAPRRERNSSRTDPQILLLHLEARTIMRGVIIWLGPHSFLHGKPAYNLCRGALLVGLTFALPIVGIRLQNGPRCLTAESAGYAFKAIWQARAGISPFVVTVLPSHRQSSVEAMTDFPRTI